MSTLKDVMLILEIRPGMIMGRPGGFNLREIGIYINGFIHGCAQEGFGFIHFTVPEGSQTVLWKGPSGN